MKFAVAFVLLLIVAMITSACGGSGSAAVSPTAASESAVVEDQADLVAALEAAGATVEVGEPITQAFFAPQGTIIRVNGADVQVFEYESPEAMENDASQVDPEGGSIGTSAVMWMDTPHFYKTGRIIVLYVGSDETVLGFLNTVLGAQFAGG